jgi:hypothetical protein
MFASPDEHARSRPPRLIIVLELEQVGQARLDAATYEDELRLRHWLHRSGTLRRLPVNVVHHLDRLNEQERAA